MEKLLKAPFWVEEKWRTLRESFQRKRELPTLQVQPDAASASVSFPAPKPDAPAHSVVLYKAQETAIPTAAKEMPVGLIVVDARAHTRADGSWTGIRLVLYLFSDVDWKWMSKCISRSLFGDEVRRFLALCRSRCPGAFKKGQGQPATYLG